MKFLPHLGRLLLKHLNLPLSLLGHMFFLASHMCEQLFQARIDVLPVSLKPALWVNLYL